MKIAVDLDDVCADYVGECIRTYGWPCCWSVFLREMWPTVNWHEHFNPVNHNMFLYGLQPIFGAADGVKMLGLHNDVFYFTASSPASTDIRRMWLSHNGFPDYDIVATNGFEKKKEWIYNPDNEIDVLIEDLSPVLRAAVRSGIDAICYHTPWNTTFRGKRAYKWSEVELLLEPQKSTLTATS